MGWRDAPLIGAGWQSAPLVEDEETEPGYLNLIGRGLGRARAMASQGIAGGRALARDWVPPAGPFGLGANLAGRGLDLLLGTPEEQYLAAEQRRLANVPPPELDIDLSTAEGRRKALEHPGRYLTSQAAETLPSTIPGYATAFATQNPVVGGLVAGLQESLPDYLRQTMAGMPRQEALARLVPKTAAIGVLNMVPMGGVLKGIPGLGGIAGRLIAGGLGEPLTEWAEEPVSALLDTANLEAAKSLLTSGPFAQGGNLPEVREQVRQSMQQGLNVIPGSALSGLLLGGAGSVRTTPSQIDQEAFERRLKGLPGPPGGAPGAAQEAPATPVPTPRRSPVAEAVQRALGEAQEQPEAAFPESLATGVAEPTASYGQPGPAWYSQAQRLVEQGPAKAAGPAWLAYLRNKGAKADELKWTGADEWLAGQGKAVSKEELLDYLRAHEVRVEEVLKGGRSERDVNAEARTRAIGIGEAAEGKDWDSLTPIQRQHYLQVAIDEVLAEQDSGGGPRFANWQLPGGENYRELLLTWNQHNRLDDAQIEATGINPVSGRPFVRFTWHGQRYVAEKNPGETDQQAMLRRLNSTMGLGAGEQRERGFVGGHYDEPNVLAHVRFNDRTDAGGKRVLFIEEIQSDWHQKGRKEGYRTAAKINTNGWHVGPNPFRDGERTVFDQDNNPQGAVAVLAGNENVSDEEAISRAATFLSEKFATGRIPDAPFKTTWPELALKRMIRWAAENGYDRIAWTPGEVQADRYDLSKQVSTVDIYKYSDDDYRLIARPINQQGAINEDHVPLSRVETMVGKDLAEKASQQQAQSGRSYSGLDLKVGGEGMRGFYDKILVDAANRIGKRFGAKVGMTTIEVGVERAGPHAAVGIGRPIGPKMGQVHSLDITPQMRESVMQGQPIMQPETPYAQAQNTKRRVSLGFKPGTGSEHEGRGEFTESAVERLVNEAARRTGVTIRGTNVGPGAYLADPETSVQVDVEGPLPAIENFSSIAGHAMRQSQVLISKPSPQGATRGFTLAPAAGDLFANPAEAERFMADIRSRLGPEATIANGYQVIRQGGKSALRVFRGYWDNDLNRVVYKGGWPNNEVEAFSVAASAEAAKRGIDLEAEWGNYDVETKDNDWSTQRQGEGYRADLLARAGGLLERGLGDRELQATEADFVSAAPAPREQAESQVADPTHAYAGQAVQVGEQQLSFAGFETRPDTTAEQVQKGNAFIGALIAFRDRLAGARALADSITRDFIHHGFTSLVGQIARSGHALAILAQIYRDPRVETLRLFAVDAVGRIIGQTGITQRMPGVVNFGPQTYAQWARFLKSKGAVGYYIVHNHPSGNATPSSRAALIRMGADPMDATGGDVEMTAQAVRALAGFQFKGHIVIDHNQYTVIGKKSISARAIAAADHRAMLGMPEAATEPKVIQKDFGGYDPKANPRIAHPELSSNILDPAELAAVGMRINADPNEVTIITTGAMGNVASITAFPQELFDVPSVTDQQTRAGKRKFNQIAARLRRLRAASGAAGYVFAVTGNPQSLHQAWLEGFVVDVVDLNTGQTMGAGWNQSATSGQLMIRGRGVQHVRQGMGRSNVTDVAEPGVTYRQGAPATGSQAPPQPGIGRQTIEVGGGRYTTAPNLGIDPEAQRILLDVLEMPKTGARVAAERGPETVSNEETIARARALLGTEFGSLLNDLWNRAPRSALNADRLAALAQLVNTAAVATRQAADVYARSGSAQDLQALAAAKERLGLSLAPFMGYRTEAGRALQILQAVQSDFTDALSIFEALGNGTQQSLQDFARRVKEAGSVEEVLKLTRAAYQPTLWDQFYEYWINGLLSGPWTHLVNMTSNGLFNALEVATELATGALSGNVSARGALRRISGQVSGLQLGLANAGKAFLTEEPQLTARTQIESERHQAIPGRLGRAVRIPGRALLAEDELAKAIVFTGDLHRIAVERAQATNVPFDQALAALANDPEAQAEARRTADRMTFQTPLGPVGRSGLYWLNRSKVGRIIVPFVRTPTNILKRATEYSPAAPIMQEVRDSLTGTDKRSRDLAIGRMVVGSSMMLGIMGMVAQGMITGAGPDDPRERELWMRTGRKPYSIRVGDRWIRYNRFEPVGMILGVSADLGEIGQAIPEKKLEDIATMLMSSVALNLGDKTFLRGVVDFANAYSDPKQYLGRWAQGLAGTLVPNIAAQGARALDPYVREARNLTDSFRARVPGAREALPAKLDIAGEPIERSVVEPLAATQEKRDPLAEAMLAVGAFKGSPNRSLQIGGHRYEFSPAEYEDYKAFVQQTRWRILSPIAASPQFRALMSRDPLHAKDLLESHWDKIGRQARDAYLIRHPELIAKVMTQRIPAGGSRYVEANP